MPQSAGLRRNRHRATSEACGAAARQRGREDECENKGSEQCSVWREAKRTRVRGRTIRCLAHQGPPQPGLVCSCSDALPTAPEGHAYGKSRSSLPAFSRPVASDWTLSHRLGGAGSVYCSVPPAAGERCTELPPPSGAELCASSVLLRKRTSPLSTCVAMCDGNQR
eukprot:7012776-Prymnesium_polylepis.1